MRIVLGYERLAQFAGSELYLVLLAEQLQELGHTVWTHAHDLGPAAELARERGLEVATEGDLPDECDAVLSQDGRTAYELAERYPRAARIFVCHSTEFAAQSPPLAEGACHALVALNGRVAEHLRAAPGPEVVRLRQPVDVLRLSRVAPPRERLERLVVFGHVHAGEQLGRIGRVCERLGIELVRAGGRHNTTPGPERALADGDAVLGIGRCVIEAMAARRAAYVSGVVGTDGWVTPESYPALEADGFSGRASGGVLAEDRLEADLAAWTPELGEQGKDLAYAGHDAAAHARELIELWERLGAHVGQPPDGAAELARLSRVAAAHQQRALESATEAAVQRSKAVALQQEIDALKATRRYRLAGALTRPLDGFRRLAGRGRRRD
jgi:hypothetical protein